MMGRLVVWLVGWTLKRNLSLAEKNALIVHILTSLQAIPLTDILTISEEGVRIQGRLIDTEQAIVLREAATLALNNKAFALVRDQVTYLAFVQAGMKAATADALVFPRAALWWGQQEVEYLQLLAQKQEQPEL